MSPERGLSICGRPATPCWTPRRRWPTTSSLGETYDTLVITGPNTGGKTVTLKTIGLLTLMAQCGLHIPVADRSAVSESASGCWQTSGDEQSIAQSLSTFSCPHGATSWSILKEADGDTPDPL